MFDRLLSLTEGAFNNSGWDDDPAASFREGAISRMVGEIKKLQMDADEQEQIMKRIHHMLETEIDDS